jgi:hypothetical protein
MFSGILFCGDCNAKMHLQGVRANPEKLSYSCGTYRNGKTRLNTDCSMHFIRQNVLKDLILADLQRLLNEVKFDKQKFIDNALKSAQNRRLNENLIKQKEYNKAKKRVSELDKLFRQLYEDKTFGKITDVQFTTLTADFANEKENLATLISEFETAQMQLNEDKQDITKFIRIVDKYTEITELNYEILHEFIDRVNIFETDKETKTRKIEIIYNFIGAVNSTAPRPTHETPKSKNHKYVQTVVC